MPALPEDQLHPPLRGWSRVWRYLVAAAVGVGAWAAASADRLSAPLTAAQQDVLGAVLFVDLVVGAGTLALLPLRRRYPLAVASLTTAASAVSVAGMGPAALAVVSMATWRRRTWVVVVAAVFLAARAVSEFGYIPLFVPAPGVLDTSVGIILGLVSYAATVAIGYYAATRRALIASLQERVVTAERERALTTEVAREAERTRIAREMHDVLAHRISLVALHAGALAYREDLDRVQTAETARTIQGNAQLALTSSARFSECCGPGPARTASSHHSRPSPSWRPCSPTRGRLARRSSSTPRTSRQWPAGSCRGFPRRSRAPRCGSCRSR